MGDQPTYLSHDLAQRHLLEVGGLPAHVGPGDDDEVAALGNVAVVGDGLLSGNALQDRVSAILDRQRVCKLGAHWSE